MDKIIFGRAFLKYTHICREYSFIELELSDVMYL